MKDSYGRRDKLYKDFGNGQVQSPVPVLHAAEGVRFARSDKLLTFGEIVRIADICGRMGIVNIRRQAENRLCEKIFLF